MYGILSSIVLMLYRVWCVWAMMVLYGLWPRTASCTCALASLTSIQPGHRMYGIVWYGIVWYGMVWYCMVLYGIVWYGMVFFIVINCTVFLIAVRSFIFLLLI